MPDKKKYHEIVTDAWGLMKEHLDGADFDKEYEQVLALSEKYKGTPEYDFATDIITSVMTEINRLYGGGE